MNVEKGFHMNGGDDLTSYAKNSCFQKGVADTAKEITMESLQEVYLRLIPNSLGIADLGCSSGDNSLTTIKEMVNAIKKTSHKISKPMPEFRVHLNDLITNDFSLLFSALPEFYKDLHKSEDNGAPFIYIGAYPGSFYGKLFPSNSLHFVYSSMSLHWLSKIPEGLYDEKGKSINKTSICISESSPPQVSAAYYKQFQEDMSRFLRSRAEEVVNGGKMVLIITARTGKNHIDNLFYIMWELLSRSFAILVSQGEIEKEKLESYNILWYTPSKQEIEDEVIKEGSFEMERLEILETPDGMRSGKTTALIIRAINESAIKLHFGDQIIDNLFDHFARLVDEESLKGKIIGTTAAVVLKRKICTAAKQLL